MNIITITKECTLINYAVFLHILLNNYNDRNFYNIETIEKSNLKKDVILMKLKEDVKIVYECDIVNM
jgi:hypothetical protein